MHLRAALPGLACLAFLGFFPLAEGTVYAAAVATTAEASAGELQAWATQAFDPHAPAAPTQPTHPELTVRRQDHGQLQRGRSVMKMPIRIGSKAFSHGLGTHANSEIAVALPAGVKTFEAKVGIDTDNNRGGSVIFSVEAGGKELFRSGVLRGDDEPVDVKVDLPSGVDELVLKTDTTPDGPSNDHADWADARLIASDGATRWLDELPLADEPAAPSEFLPVDSFPFSFVYNGARSAALLKRWPRKIEEKPPADAAASVKRTVSWTDPDTGLKVFADVTSYTHFPAAEWVLRFESGGAQDTPILENVQALDLTLGTRGESPLVLEQINGSNASERDFVPSERPINCGDDIRFAPHGGRSSDTTFPFFNLRSADGGVFAAIGWTGQWACAVRRAPSGATSVQAGMELTHLKLHPGESIRTPRVLLMRWSGESAEAHNTFRRLMLAHYQPRVNGQLPHLAVGAQMFNSWAGGARPDWGTEAGQIAAARVNQKIGADTLWMDAGWFPGYFPNGAGNWFPRAKDFPNGLRPVGEECRKLGLRFLVWFEPERVAPNTQIANEHPEFVLGGKAGGLFNLGNEKARRWMADLLNREIDDWQLACYRQDFNMDPLPYWRNNDAPDRQGITEIRHVEGLYALWDELLAKHPGLYIDNCASGGRRIDLETCRRAVVQTRSDSEGVAGRADWEQSQTYGLSQYLPLSATFTWDMATYDFRSYTTAGFVGEWDLLSPNFPADAVRAAIEEAKQNQRYWTGDFYQLTPWTMSPDKWMAFQFHLPNADEGMVLAFRHKAARDDSIKVSLRGVKPEQRYAVEFIDEERKVTGKEMSGRELGGLELRIDKQRASLLVRYKPATAGANRPGGS